MAVGRKVSAPLGSQAARTLPIRDLEEDTMRHLGEWMRHHPGTWVALSGGKDSTVVAHMARRINPTVPLVFYDSGAEFPQTLTYLDTLNQAWGGITTIPADPDVITLIESDEFLTHAHTATRARASVSMRRVLIDEPERQARTMLGCDWNLLGLRAAESQGRRIALTPTRGVLTRHKDGTFVSGSYCPIWRWRSDQVHAYLATHHIPPNPLYRDMETLGIPPRLSRMSLMVDGSLLMEGRWATAYQLAPARALQIETRLPRLRQLR